MMFTLRFPGFLSAIASLWLVASVSTAQAASPEAAGAYVDKLGTQALAAISDKSLSKSGKQDALEKLFVDNVDFAWVGRFVMGRFWRQATEEQKARYLKEYQKFLTLHYTSRFTDYTGGSFKIAETRDDGDNEYTVSTQMGTTDPQAEPVLVDYKVRREGAGYKIFDVIVEGVSLITTQRSEFAAILNQNGIDYLIDMLADRSRTNEAAAAKTGKK